MMNSVDSASWVDRTGAIRRQCVFESFISRSRSTSAAAPASLRRIGGSQRFHQAVGQTDIGDRDIAP